MGFYLFFNQVSLRKPEGSIPPAITIPDISGAGEAAAFFLAAAVPDAGTAMVHAPSVVALQNGDIRTFWYGGSREGAADVNLYSALYSATSWNKPQVIITRKDLQFYQKRLIRKLGNPVALLHPNGKLYLFFVSVSVGGWAGSSINWMTSANGGESWSEPERLISSPFLNISTLVKGTPLVTKEGTIFLPVYHEFIGKFSELLKISPGGKVLAKHRISKGRHTLQPVLFSTGQELTALMRYAGKKQPAMAWQAGSQDGGETWEGLGSSEIPNPNSALTGATFQHENSFFSLLVANNNSFERDELSLLMKSQGGPWQVVKVLENRTGFNATGREKAEYLEDLQQEEWLQDWPNKEQVLLKVEGNMCSEPLCFYQYDYPYLVHDSNGFFHVVYTWNKTVIKHLVFNQAWIESNKEGIK